MRVVRAPYDFDSSLFTIDTDAIVGFDFGRRCTCPSNQSQVVLVTNDFSVADEAAVGGCGADTREH